MIKLYYAFNNKLLNSEAYQEYLKRMPDDVVCKILRFKRWQDAQASLFGKLLLQDGLKSMLLSYDLTNVKYNKYGKPFINRDIDFNISHSGKMVVCAISTEGEIGVDTEELKPITTDDFINHFTSVEWSEIHKGNNLSNNFYYHWTAKEAVIKAIGKGLSIPLQDISIERDCAYIYNEKWSLKLINISPDYMIQLAFKRHEAANILLERRYF